jgi:uncharacterized damage-inducible protein DinB
MTRNEQALRAQLAEFLDWRNAHADFDQVVKGVPSRKRGVVPKGFAHSVWQLVEHMRIAQADILDFCVNPRYEHTMKWPDDYWPRRPAPPSDAAWKKALASFRRDLKTMQRLAKNRRIDLFARIPCGSGQTVLREILLVADHNAHHLAQIIDVRRALGIWG